MNMYDITHQKIHFNKFTVMATSSTSLHWQRRHTYNLSLLLCYAIIICCCCSNIIKPVNGALAVETPSKKDLRHMDHCVVVLENNQIVKEIGSVWVSSQDPCAIHTCEADNTGHVREIITKEDCGQFYCDVDSELRPQQNTCCGACVRTKCRFNDTIYEVGQTWHNNADCTLLECAQLPNGQPIINAYEKTCPPLPPDCELENIYIQDCCRYCRNRLDANPRSILSENEDIWTEDFYRNHPCVRECKTNEPPMKCQYKFLVEWYQTLSKACYDCPNNASDCERPHCIIGDGIPRSITVVNRMMPGPSIEVCENDEIIVDVTNDLLGESTTIHWHGMHQRDTPYMDGVPHISQCPISPHASFRYSFRAENSGTHFWHSHTGMQRGDGVFGALIIRRPRAADPHAHLYDFDLPEHKMIVQDWVHEPGISIFASHHHSRGDNKPRNLLINGHGRYYKAIWEMIKSEAKSRSDGDGKSVRETTESVDAVPSTTEALEITTETQQDYHDVIDYLHPSHSVGKINIHVRNDISRLARLAIPDNIYSGSASLVENANTNSSLNNTAHAEHGVEHNSTQIAHITKMLPVAMNSSQVDNGSHTLSNTNFTAHNLRLKRETDDNYNISLEAIPLQVYTVRRGFRFRFRIINAEFLNCPIMISIDNHSLIAINSDGYDFEPVEVGSIVTYAGERFDFVVNANQSVGNYWIRLKGLMDCSELFTSAFQAAILRYEGAPAVEPQGELSYGHKAEGVELNAMNRGSGHTDSLTIAELNALPSYDSVPGIDRDALKPVADYKFFVYYDFYAKDNPAFHPSDYYGFNANITKPNRLYTPQLNHISLKFPSIALLPQRDDIDSSAFCNDTSLEAQGIDCRKEFCKCHHVLQVPLNSIVELIVVDEGFTFDANHPFHLHGNAFRVVGLERLGANVTIEMVQQLDRYNLLKRNLVRPPIKDTVTIPDGGYTIIRFEAYNPGFWLFHCHIEFHAEIGMALVLKVGENDEMLPVPKNFPTCHDYMPSGNEAAENQQQTPAPNGDGHGPSMSADNGGASTIAYSINTMRFLIIFITLKSIFLQS